MRPSSSHGLLGGLSARAFLRSHWQKSARLIRQAVPGFTGLIEPMDLMALATGEQCRSRLVVRAGNKWTLRHGPFSPRELKKLPSKGWSLLVQDVNTVLPTAQDLLMQFRFIPFARLDDLMVSLAPDGGGVGPHFDRYDVFLLQGMGQRRWELSTQSDRRLVEDAPLKTLRAFKPTRVHNLSPGDMLYLPPKVSHNGIAVGTCMTYSVGFRAPSMRELISGYLAHLDDMEHTDELYADPDLRPTSSPAQLPAPLLRSAVRQVRRLDLSAVQVSIFLGKYLTEPAPHIWFAPPPSPLPLSKFATVVARRGARLSLCTRMLWHAGSVFINGEQLRTSTVTSTHLRTLADQRSLAPAGKLPSALLQTLHQWYRAGYLLLNETWS